MTPIILLQGLKRAILEWTKDLILEVKSKQDEEKESRQADVYIGNPPVKESPTKYVPYFCLQFIAGQDWQNEREDVEASAKIRVIAVAYSKDAEKGYIDALNMIDRVKINLVRERIIDKKFSLNMKTPLEYVIYEGDTGNYTIADMVITFDMPVVRQEVDKIWH